MYLDFIPGPKGQEGQVITLVSECDFAWLGASFRDFLTRYVELCERRELIWIPSEQRVDWAHRENFWDSWEHLFM
jgi:cell wall assembly regulator SMI1